MYKQLNIYVIVILDSNKHTVGSHDILHSIKTLQAHTKAVIYFHTETTLLTTFSFSSTIDRIPIILAIEACKIYLPLIQLTLYLSMYIMSVKHTSLIFNVATILSRGHSPQLVSVL